MLIYSEKITARLRYIAETLLGRYTTAIHLTESADEFFLYDGAKICYAHKKFSTQELHIQPAGLLIQSTVQKQRINCFDWNGLKAFFQTNGDVPFDIFSAAFYLLSRYEEYLPHNKDSYGRFAHTESLAFKEGFLHLPLVNLWIDELLKLMKRRFPSLAISTPDFNFTPTYDIDIAYAYKGKGLLRNGAAIAKAFAKRNFSKAAEIRRIASSNKRDPFDVYSWLHELHVKFALKPIYFFLLAKQRSEYDKNLSPKSQVLQTLIQNTAKANVTGIHPSWKSYADEALLVSEKALLQRLTNTDVKLSRQHYIQFTLPQTYRELIDVGITDDYSMGYGSINGFRASYGNSFYWYDLMKEEPSKLMLHPFCFMEANAYFEQRLSVKEAAEELQHYYNITKQVNGEFITIFHNHFLTEEEQWMPWRSMYAEFLHRNYGSSIAD